MCFGRRLMNIATEKHSVDLPRAIDDELLSDIKGKWNSQPKDVPSLLEAYIQTIKLYNILGHVLDDDEPYESAFHRNADQSSKEATLDFNALLDLDTAAMKWRDSLPSYLRFDPTSTADFDEPRDESLVSDGQAIHGPDFYRQAKRLYLRYLHTRLLIQRPALDLLFKRQNRNKVAARTEPPEFPLLHDLMLRNIAPQCLLIAHKMVEFLDADIRSRDLLAWWYNVSCKFT